MLKADLIVCTRKDNNLKNVCGQVFHGTKWKLNLTRVADHQWQWPLYFGHGPIWSRSCCLWKWWSTVLPWIRFRLPWPSCITTRKRGNGVDCGSNATSKPLNKWRPNCASFSRFAVVIIVRNTCDMHPVINRPKEDPLQGFDVELLPVYSHLPCSVEINAPDRSPGPSLCFLLLVWFGNSSIRVPGSLNTAGKKRIFNNTIELYCTSC